MEINIEKIKMDDSWKEILRDEFHKQYFADIKTNYIGALQSGATVYPPSNLIFNAFNKTPLHKVKAVILGQDPYHGVGQAMGLCFSVPKGIKIPASLRNIYKELNRSFGCQIPTHGDLSSWADEGVFMLNAILSVEDGKASSHKNFGWQYFTDAVISALSNHKEHIVFLLWGNFAKEKKSLIDEKKHLILESSHPSPLAGNSFVGNGHFLKANEYLIKNDIEPINWEIRS